MSPKPAPQKTQTHSTGPRTAAGKAVSSQNAMRHGLASGTLFVEGEDHSEWETLFTSLVEEWQPATTTEHLLVHSMAKHHWLVERALRLQGEALSAAAPGMLPPAFPVLLRYQTTNERAFCRAQKSLEDMQRVRRQFVSQKESQTSRERYQKTFARVSAPLLSPDYNKIIERMNAASPSTPPQTVAAPIR